MQDIFLGKDKIEYIFGTNVSIRAALVLRGGECYLVQDLKSLESLNRVEVYMPGLEKKLDSCVGGWVGGPASYFDLIEVTGLINEGTTRKNGLSISGISRMILERDGERFDIY